MTKNNKITIQLIRKNQTHCINGHKFTVENTAIRVHRSGSRKGQSYRQCISCHRIRRKEQLVRDRLKKLNKLSDSQD